MKVYVKKSKIGGKGLFTKHKIKKGSVIGTVKGKKLPDNQETSKKFGEHYLHPISHSKVILNSNFTKYTNHSCEPNCGLKKGIRIVAMKDIKKDEEITINYNVLEYDWKMKCNCGSKNCRKIIRGYKYLPENLKERYKGFISPYLLKPKP